MLVLNCNILWVLTRSRHNFNFDFLSRQIINYQIPPRALTIIASDWGGKESISARLAVWENLRMSLYLLDLAARVQWFVSYHTQNLSLLLRCWRTSFNRLMMKMGEKNLISIIKLTDFQRVHEQTSDVNGEKGLSGFKWSFPSLSTGRRCQCHERKISVGATVFS